MAMTYIDWVGAKLAGAPPNASVFLIDVHRLLRRRNGGAYDDVEMQEFDDDNGHTWTVVSYRANALPARRLLATRNSRVIVWCLGEHAGASVDLTPFEDYLGLAWRLVEISLDAISEELRPELLLPRDLTETICGIKFDAAAYVHALSELARETPLTKVSALNALIELTCGRRGVDTSSPSATLMSTAVCYAADLGDNSTRIVRLVLGAAADIDIRYRGLLQLLANNEPRDVILAAGIGSAFARLKLHNAGALLAAEGLCPPELRAAYEEAGGTWSELANRLDPEELAFLAPAIERVASTSVAPRLRDLFADSQINVVSATSEPLAAVRFAAIISHLEAFIGSTLSASAVPAATPSHNRELHSLDQLAGAIRTAELVRASPAPTRTRLGEIAHEFASSTTAGASLALARGRIAARFIEDQLRPATAARVHEMMRTAKRDIDASFDLWNAAWTTAISLDVNAYLSHERQGWRCTSAFADAAMHQESWFIVFDGLRLDLWRGVLAPALERAGWRANGTDLSFSFLPSLTDVSRRTLVGASPEAVRGDEKRLTEAVAARSDLLASYVLRTEQMSVQHEDAKGWNVRVFSWPDKFVHSDLADLGTLAQVFETWVKDEFVPWLRKNVAPTARIAVSTDHGFAALESEDAIDVDAADGADRNTPRVIPGAHSALAAHGLVVEDAGKRVTIATGRRWFRGPNSRPWNFAHGGCTLDEALVPFAQLAAVRDGVAIITIEGLPQSLSLREGEEAVVSFSVKVTGGSTGFGRVVVATNQRTLADRELTLETVYPLEARVKGTEGLDRLRVTVTSGTARQDKAIAIRVELSKLKRAELDLDI